MMYFLDLPVEILQHITHFLPASSILKLGLTCKHLLDVINIDSVWHQLCLREYQTGSNDGWHLSYRDFYSKGWQRLALRPYGGLSFVEWGKGEIKILEYHPRPGASTSDKLVCQPLYSITWNNDHGALEAQCLQSTEGSKPATLAQGCDGKDNLYPVLQCSSKQCWEKHVDYKKGRARSGKKFDQEFEGHQNAFKICFYQGSNCPMLPFPSWSEGDHIKSPVKLGLYTGDYSSHGIEILYLHFPTEQPRTLTGLKVTGDPNVPAGYSSLEVFLDKPLQPSIEEQDSVELMLASMEERSDESCVALRESLGINSDGRPPVFRQPFHLPHDLYDVRNPAPSNISLSRYEGRGRIAMTYYRRPGFCRCHFVQFSDTMFGILWLDLNSFSMFHLAQGLPVDFVPG